MDIMEEVAQRLVKMYYQAASKLEFLEACENLGVPSNEAFLVFEVIERVIDTNEH